MRWSSRLLTPTGAAALAELDSRLGEHSVHESVGPAGGGGQRANALSGGVSLHQVFGERLSLASDDSATLLSAGGCARGCHVDSSRPRLCGSIPDPPIRPPPTIMR